MIRSFRRTALALLSLATVAAPRLAAQDTRPTVAVLDFDNNSFGKDRADYDNVGKGVADLLIGDLASKTNTRVVERERLQAIMAEQNMAKSGVIDPQTAVKLGKLLGARYMITGGFMSDGRGQMVLTSRVIDVETSAIRDPQKVQAKTDDVLGLIAQLSDRLTTQLKLPALAAIQAGEEKVAKAEAKEEGKAEAAHEHMHDAPKAEAKVAEKVAEKVAAKPAAKPVEKHVAQAPAKKPAGKLDLSTALLYSKALDAEDRGNRKEATELYRAVLAKFPDMPQAKQKLAKLGA